MRKLTTPYPSASTACHDEAVERLLAPSTFYQRPHQVLDDLSRSDGEKRAILASWASDACAVASCPHLRQPGFAAEPVTFDEVMDALLTLDRKAGPETERRSQNLAA